MLCIRLTRATERVRDAEKRKDDKLKSIERYASLTLPYRDCLTLETESSRITQLAVAPCSCCGVCQSA